MKAIYLAAFKAYHPGHDVVYQDINGKRDIAGDMMDVDLSPYDVLIATPPCNWWSKANYRRNSSPYSLATRHLLPSILYKFIESGKPFIVENVRNRALFSKHHLYCLNCFVYQIGRHTYWTNVLLPQFPPFPPEDLIHKNTRNRQGGEQVHIVIEWFLDYLENLERN